MTSPKTAMVGVRLHHVTPDVGWHLFGQERARAGRLSLVSPVEVASPSFKPDIREVANARGVRGVAVAEHRDIDQVC